MIRAGVAGLVAAVVPIVGRAAPRAADPPVDDEQQIGQEVFNELKARVEIIGASPLYDVLRPIAAPIVKTAQPRYKHPFTLYLVHEPRPNAFASPGGNVYVTDQLLYFAKNTEELAGTLCHEFAHTIRHDTMTLIEEQQRLARRGIGAAILLGPSPAKVLAISLLGKLTSLSYSRDVEAEADLAGADLCAASGSNPWGLVWLFQDFDRADTERVPQLVSDHPDNARRSEALRAHFRQNPATFGAFSSDIARARPLTVPRDAPVVFAR
jgi:predicted Zn-dependent protease